MWPRIHTAHGHWLGELEIDGREPPLEGELDADVVVIGGGYTGLWSAWRILEHEPEARVVVLEAKRCGTGPSGRNGGFVNGYWFSLPNMRRRFGDEPAVRLCRAAEDSVAQVGEFCEREGVDAQYLHAGYMQASAAPAQDDTWQEIVEACAELGVEGAVRALTPAEVRERCDSPLFRGGALYRAGATVHPARLAQGLRARLIDRGATIREGSPVTGLRASPGIVAETAGGRVRAGAAVVAVGGASLGLAPLRNRLTLTSSHMVVTEPVPDVIEELGWTGGEAITDSRAMIHYFRTTRDDRIAFGWGGGRIVPGARLDGRAEVDPQLGPEVARHMVRFFPQLEGRRIDHAWGGPIDVSPSHLPMVGSLDPDPVHYAFGYTGHGVGPSQMVGRILASLALGRRDEYTRLPLVEHSAARVPPEPLRYVGGSIVRRALLRKERMEEEGRRPDLVTRAVAGLPERMGVHIGR